MDKKLLEKPENYYNREMSWLTPEFPEYHRIKSV